MHKVWSTATTRTYSIIIQYNYFCAVPQLVPGEGNSCWLTHLTWQARNRQLTSTLARGDCHLVSGPHAASASFDARVIHQRVLQSGVVLTESQYRLTIINFSELYVPAHVFFEICFVFWQ